MQKLYGKRKIIIPKGFEIPVISDSRLLELYTNIKPIVDINGTKYFIRNFSLLELRELSYFWNIMNSKTEAINLNELKEVKSFICMHKVNLYSPFKSSIAEVLAQIPSDIVDKVNAFEIVEYPKTDDDIVKYYDNGFHLSKVMTYRVNNL